MKGGYVRNFDSLSIKDTAIAGGKNTSLGEMIRKLKKKNVMVPDGFATTARAYREFIGHNKLKQKITNEINAYKKKKKSLKKTGSAIRKMILRGEFPAGISGEIKKHYAQLSRKYNEKNTDTAVRSSATAEDLPGASFAGQQETYLNIRGKNNVIGACKKCYASLFTDRAISYREEKGFDHMKTALSAGVQKMVRSDKAGSGVMFSIDTDTGFEKVVLINAAYGLGENVVRGTVTPDEYRVFKPLISKKGARPVIEKVMGTKKKKMVYSKKSGKNTANVSTGEKERNSFVLSEKEMLKLAGWAAAIEEYYGKPMDMEWAKDGRSGKLYIVQARPETVQSQKSKTTLKTYKLREKSKILAKGTAISDAIASGRAQIIKSAKNVEKFEKGNILITGMTDPDWVPVMKKSAAIVTEKGGRTSHAAIVSRELGIPAVVGTGNAMSKIKDKSKITVSCAQGEEGYVYKGKLKYNEKEVDYSKIPKTKTKVMMNIASPPAAFRWWRLPVDGIGLARMEFIINNVIKIHPMALMKPGAVKDKKEKEKIKKLTKGYKDRKKYFVDNLAMGISTIAASVYPKPVIVRMSDFKTNEYAGLIGGKHFEPSEDNPMIGFRGASRYYSEKYKEGFSLECRAIKRAREGKGFGNIIVMIPFCRTPEEADRVLKVMEKNGLKRGKNGLKVYVMAEIPSNVMLAGGFSKRFDGFSIGSNDLTQLTLGIDRDSEELSELFDEKNEAVKRTIAMLLKEARKNKKKTGICGQAPSHYPEFASFLVKNKIDSMSLNPDSFIKAKKIIAETEKNK